MFYTVHQYQILTNGGGDPKLQKNANVIKYISHLHDGHVDLLHAEDVDGEDGEELEVLRAVVPQLVVDAPEVAREQFLSQGVA